MADKTEIQRLDTPEQFEKETGLKTTPEVWRPINTTFAKLAELKDQLASLPQAEKDARTRAFIEANKAEWVTTKTTPALTAGVTWWVVAAIDKWVEKNGFLKDMWWSMKEWIQWWFDENLKDLMTPPGKDADMWDKFIFQLKKFFFPLFAPLFGIDLKKYGFKSGSQIASEAEQKNAPSAVIKSIDQNAKSGKTTLVSKLLVRFSPAYQKDEDLYTKKGWQNASAIIASDVFQRKTFAELEQIRKTNPNVNYSSTLEKLLPVTNVKDSKETWYALDVLISSESRISAFTKNPNWKSLPLTELIPTLHGEMSIMQGFESIRTREDLEKFFQTDIFEWGKLSENTSSRIEHLRTQYAGLTPVLITHILGNTPASYEWVGLDDVTYASEKEFLGKLKWYKDGLLSNMKTTPAMNLGMDVSSMIQDLRPHEALKFFVLTGGKTDYSQFSIFEKVLFYKAVINTLGNDNLRDTNSRSYQYMTALLEGIANESSNIPPEVKSFLWTTLINVAKKMAQEAGDAISWWFLGLSLENQLKVAAVVAVLAIAIPHVRVAVVGTKALIIGLAVGIGGMTLAQAMSASDSDILTKIKGK